jgi:preprotein translocase subunit SecF
MKLLKLVPDNTNIDFLKFKWPAVIISIFLVLASLALVATRGLNLGVDFKGGILMEVNFSTAPRLDAVRSQLNGLGLGDVAIQTFGKPTDIAMRVPFQQGGEKAQQKAVEVIKSALTQKYGANSYKVRRVETVGGKVGGELRKSAIWSSTIGMLAIAAYIWLRFEWQFGVGALLSLIHDVALTLGFFSLTQMEFNLSIVAAILTIIGYSLNDTIVVYDRIRENLRKYRKMDIQALLNLSTNETLSRTMMTSLSIMLTLAALLILGGDVIRGFTAAMLLGVFIGTYSSVYIAAPMLIWMKLRRDTFITDDEVKGMKTAR